METVMLILTILGTVATIISTIISVRAKNEAIATLNKIHIERNKNTSVSGDIFIENSGANEGIITGINTGEVHNNDK